MENAITKRYIKIPLPTRSSIKLILLIIFFTMVGAVWGFHLGEQYARNKLLSTTPPTPTPDKPIGQLCKQYGLMLPEDYFQQYKVGKGETPVSIVEKVYGSESRAAEFITLNNLYGVHITAPDELLTVGESVYLPPKEIKSSSGSLYVKAGLVRKFVDNTIWIQTRTVNAEDGDTPIETNSRTVYVTQPKVGQCITAVIDNKSDFFSIHQSLLIKSQ